VNRVKLKPCLKMKNVIDTIIKSVQNTDDWTQSSVFGTCYYQAASAAINLGLNIIETADLEEGSGIDGFARWMEKTACLQPQQLADLNALGALAEKLAVLVGGVSMSVPTLEDHVAFRIATHKPSQEVSQQKYRDLRAAGERFKISMKQWVTEHYSNNLKQHTRLIDHSDDAITLIKRALRDPMKEWEDHMYVDGPNSKRPAEHDDQVEYHRIPEWLFETLVDKALDKLYARRYKTESRTRAANLRQAARDAATADLFRIDAAITALGENPPATVYVDEEGNPTEYSRIVKKGKKLEIEFSDELF